MNAARALVVDDEPDICELLDITLARMQIEVKAAANIAQARRLLASHAFDLCLTDMRLPDGDGLDLVEHIQQLYPALPVAVITAHGSMDAAIRALKNGAFDFLTKPVDLSVLRKLVQNTLKLNEQATIDRRSRHLLLGESASMRAIRAKIAKLARSQAPIHITGESGTGKELVARLIHEKGMRSDKPFIAINCGAIPPELMESEFFGHRKGSFSGAIADKIGFFQAADGGTLFLDEVAELSQALQVKLLRAIQEKSIRPVGDQREIPVDIRIISATHKDLARLVQQGEFRQDIYYRINVIEMRVPPLRERMEDIPMLAEHILNRLARRNQQVLPKLAQSSLDALMKYAFPGNVRELENILERAMALCEAAVIGIDDLNLAPSSAPVLTEQAVVAVHAPMEDSAISLENYMDEIEKQTIVAALEKNRWNRTATAKELGITFRALRYRLKKLGLE